MIKSGEEPPEGASADGSSCKMLGYKWNPKEDYLSPGLGELNFNPKIRGANAPNEAPVTTTEEAKEEGYSHKTGSCGQDCRGI